MIEKEVCPEGLRCCDASKAHLDKFRHRRTKEDYKKMNEMNGSLLGKRSRPPPPSKDKTYDNPSVWYSIVDLLQFPHPYDSSVIRSFDSRKFSLISFPDDYKVDLDHALSKLGVIVVPVDDPNVEVVIIGNKKQAPDTHRDLTLLEYSVSPTCRRVLENVFMEGLVTLRKQLNLPLPKPIKNIPNVSGNKERKHDIVAEPVKKKQKTSGHTNGQSNRIKNNPKAKSPSKKSVTPKKKQRHSETPNITKKKQPSTPNNNNNKKKKRHSAK